MNEIFVENEKKIKTGIRLVREELFKLVFSVELVQPSDDNLRESLELYLNVNAEILTKWREEDRNFLVSYIEGISNNYDYIKKIIVDSVDNWEFERISVVERALLRIAIYELVIRICKWCLSQNRESIIKNTKKRNYLHSSFYIYHFLIKTYLKFQVQLI